LKFVAASETGVKAEMVVQARALHRPTYWHVGRDGLADTLGAAATVLNLPRARHDHHREQDQLRRSGAVGAT